MAVSEDRLLRPRETAELVGVAVTTLKSWRNREYGPKYKRLPGERGEIRYPASSVLEFMRSDLHESYAQEVSQQLPQKVKVEPQAATTGQRATAPNQDGP